MNIYKERSDKSLVKRFKHFKKLAEKKHGVGRYDYALTQKDYVNTRSYVRITCNKCNQVFKTLPQAHTAKKRTLHGACPVCLEPSINIKDVIGIRWSKNKNNRIKDFRKRMIARHNGKYTYPNLDEEYLNEYSKITVQCGDCDHRFRRTASSLKDKNRYGGCPKCNEEDLRQTISEKNRHRQRRNYKTKNLAQPYGCIYKITNMVNGKFYIGYTNMTIEKRLKSHFDESARLSRGHTKCRSYLHNAMVKYGKETFYIEVLEAYENVSALYLAEIEKKYIAKFNPHYNVSKGGEIGQLKKGKFSYEPPKKVA